ncbi:sortase, partial [Streptococcus suis]
GTIPNLNIDSVALKKYDSILNITDTGIMGYVEIPKLQTTLPIYHGTDDAVLQVAVGHLAGTSLPIGGQGSHAAISGHRGLPSAKLFSDLDQLVIGDTFMI